MKQLHDTQVILLTQLSEYPLQNTRQLCDELDLGYDQVRYHIEKLLNSEYVSEHKKTNTKAKFYEITEAGEDALEASSYHDPTIRNKMIKVLSIFTARQNECGKKLYHYDEDLDEFVRS